MENNDFDYENDIKGGNPIPLIILCFVATGFFLAYGLILFFGDVSIKGLDGVSPMVNKIITLVIMIAISLFFVIGGIASIKLAKEYFKEKAELLKEPIDETIEDEISQQICPKCGATHDVDYVKCPNCKYSYIKKTTRL